MTDTKKTRRGIAFWLCFLLSGTLLYSALGIAYWQVLGEVQHHQTWIESIVVVLATMSLIWSALCVGALGRSTIK